MFDLALEEVLVQGVFFRVVPAHAFLPDQESSFIAHIQKSLVLRIVYAANEVGAEVFQQEQVAGDEVFILGRAELRVRFVATNALEEDWLAVEEDVFAARFDGA